VDPFEVEDNEDYGQPKNEEQSDKYNPKSICHYQVLHYQVTYQATCSFYEIRQTL